MMRDIFDPLLDLQDSRLARLGNHFVELDRCIDWDAFRGLLEQAHDKKRKSNARAHPKDVVMMFKGLVVQNFYGLSDDQLQYQIEDRRSFQHNSRVSVKPGQDQRTHSSLSMCPSLSM